MNRNRRNSYTSEEGSSDGSWMQAYGDMMTLLLTFFILIVSFSTVELIKFRKAMGALRGASGAMMEEEGTAVAQILPTMSESNIVASEELEMTLQMVEDAVLQGGGGGQNLSVDLTKDGIRFRVASLVMFESGQATLKPESFKVLAPIANLVKISGNKVTIEGHTDNVPIRSIRFPSNWELSAARAVSVVRHFVEFHGVDPTKVMPVGYGEFRPIASNDIPEERAQNRRVEICLEWLDFSGRELLDSRVGL